MHKPLAATLLAAAAILLIPTTGEAATAKPLKGDPRVCWWSTNATSCVRDNVPIALQKNGVQGDMTCTASRELLYRCTVKGTNTAGAYTVEFVKGKTAWRWVVTAR